MPTLPSPFSQQGNEGPRIYNLFPLLAGPFAAWTPHLERARQMGFNWIFVNPIQRPGMSGSLYSFLDYYELNPLLVDPGAGSPEEQLRRVIRRAHQRGMQIMMDLVINHTAVDSPLIREHPAWFRRDDTGQIIRPGAWENNNWVSWNDLAAVNNAASSERQNLWQYWLSLVNYYAALGIDGFRCDAAYQVPGDLWRFLMGSARRDFPGLQFFAETLGCTPEQTIEVARAGFDYIFNSSKWWDFSAPWCLDQLRETAPVVPSIGFAESHDTERLARELGGNHDAVQQRCVFATLFSTGVMMPIGFEYGFRRRLDVVKTRPSDWEEPSWDDTEFIQRLNAFKAGHSIWNEDSPLESLDSGNPSVAALWKTARNGRERALLLFNKDRDHEQACSRSPVADRLGNRYSEVTSALTVEPAARPDRITLVPAGFRIFLATK